MQKMSKVANSRIDDIEIGKQIIDNIFNKKSSDPAGEALRSVAVTEQDKREMAEISNTVADITGLDCAIREDRPVQSKGHQQLLGETISDNTKRIIQEVIEVLEHSPKKIPQKTVTNVFKSCEQITKYQSFLLRFLEKYM